MVGASGEVPLRILDLESDSEIQLCTMPVDLGGPRKVKRKRRSRWQRLWGLRRAEKGSSGSQFKLDPHPAWDRDSRRICFNGAPAGQRQVFVADVSEL